MDALVSYDEDVVITGASDGIIRILNILPNKLVGIVGNHEDFPVERLSLSSDKLTLASASHDDTVKLWDLAALQDDADDDDNDSSNADSGQVCSHIDCGGCISRICMCTLVANCYQRRVEAEFLAMRYFAHIECRLAPLIPACAGLPLLTRGRGGGC